DGSFVEEPVAITQPTGKLGAGKYRIVMNQCLTGYYDPLGGDIVLGDPANVGFIVQLPGGLVPIDYNPLKANATQYAEALGGNKVTLPVGGEVTIPGFCALYGKLADKAEPATNLASWAKIALDNCSDLIGHWKGIAADPPDPNYQTFAELGAIKYGSSPTATPLERAARTLANALADQSAATQALLSSTEKFQGAQQANDDEWAMLQLMQMNKFINLLLSSGGSMLRTYAALEAFDFALQRDPLGTTQEAQDLHAFIPEMRATIGAMLYPLGPNFRQYVDGYGQRQIAPVGLQSYIAVYLGQDPFLPTLDNLPGIPQERAMAGLPPIVLTNPTANAGGNYSAPPGRTINFDASKSSTPDGGSLTFAWDLDGDGNFNDGAGAQVQFSYSQPGTRLVGVKATNSLGRSNVAYSLVDIGDVNAEDVITMPLSREIYDVHANGSVSTLKPGLGYNLGGLQNLHVDVNRDIWVLSSNMLEHYDMNGNLLATITPSQVGSLAGIPLLSFVDFALDGRGDIILLANEDLGPGHLVFSIYDFYSPDLRGRTKVIRLAKDSSRASFLADVNQAYTSLQTINGVLYQYANASDGCVQSPQGISIDPDGYIVVSNMNAADPRRCANGAWKIDPDTGTMTEVIPAGGDAFGGGSVTEDPYGTFYGTNLVFGGQTLFMGGFEAGPARLGVDAQGDYVVATQDNAGMNVRVQRIPIPPQITNAAGSLKLEIFPVSLSTPGTPFLVLGGLTIDPNGDYIAVGWDFRGFLSPGVYRVTPNGEIFSVAHLSGPQGVLKVVDVVPEIRTVTPKDMPAAPAIALSNLNVTQDSCPGAAQLNVTIRNTGSGDTAIPVRVLFYDGDPSLGMVVGTAVTPGPLAAGASVTLSAPWASPGPGSHEVFALALGASPARASFMVCVPAPNAVTPILLTPPSGNSNIGTSYAVSARLLDIFGGGISGAPLMFSVSGSNTAAGTVSTDANGNAQFSYAGTNTGTDSIVATVANITSNTVAATWQGVGNQPPIANAGPDQVVEATSPAGATVTLSGAGSSDPENDPLSFTWTGPFGTLSGVSISPTLPIGMTSVSLAVSDGHGNTANDSVNVTVRDTTSPLVTPPAAITVPATEAGGARGNDWIALAAFLAGGSATDAADPAPARLAPQAGGVNVDNNTLFATGTITPVAFRFRDASGNVGTATADVTVVLGTPRISGLARAKGRDASGALYVDVQFTNRGTGNARNLKIGSILFRTLSGTGTVSYNAALSPAVPITIGSLDAGFSVTERFYLDVPSTVTRFSITESGPVQDVIGTNYNFSTGQAVYP
ncbi:MAG TPA: PKD domain-containing protein, partial [Candidatus Polarisedimenticolia bacterium]|nr:PKD domain-containing protein [Candidatus Polarisedimenticolia bacterium]